MKNVIFDENMRIFMMICPAASRVFLAAILSVCLGTVISCEKKVSFNSSEELIPQEGATVYGMVYCGSKPLKGVSVSDGVRVVTTDSRGVYNLTTAKKNGYVFISVPSGYAMADAPPLSAGFWKSLNKGKDVPERVDFSLIEENQDLFTMLVMGDTQIFSQKSIKEFNETVVPEINSYVPSVSTGPVYGLNLGDMTWDWYWYNGDMIGIDDYLQTVGALHDLPLFHTVGNHDNDMQYDSLSEFQSTGEDRTCMDEYRRKLGPTCYSYNIGGIHFVSLDNVITTNTGGTTDKDSRGYLRGVTEADMKWLEEDLYYVPEDTPVIVSVHMPLFNMSKRPIAGSSDSINSNMPDIVAPFKKFGKVLFVSGHTHYLYNVEDYDVDGLKVTEWNNGAICGNFWTTALKGLNICIDGTPGGYRILTVKNGVYSSVYKGVGKKKNYLFRTYDRNRMNLDESKLGSYTAGEIAGVNKQNWVYIYIWDYKPSWKISVEEYLTNGSSKVLTPIKIDSFDPLYMLMYEKGLTTTTPRKALTTFRVQASEATSMLIIDVKDEYGNKRSEMMKRPKDFTLDTYIKEQAE